MININEVSKSFKSQKVLDSVSLTVPRGTVCGIIGRNGSGKSVLFKCICGLCKPDAGVIYVRNKQIGKDTDVIKNAGVIIETPGFLPNFSGYRNLKFLMDLEQKNTKEIVIKAIERVGLDPHSRKKVGGYSLGMKQRLAIAQAVMSDPEIFILDEPMNGLDKEGLQDMRKLFLELKASGKTILISSHNPDDIAILCDDVYEMENGRITKVS